jgi:hypothetical protein
MANTMFRRAWTVVTGTAVTDANQDFGAKTAPAFRLETAQRAPLTRTQFRIILVALTTLRA